MISLRHQKPVRGPGAGRKPDPEFEIGFFEGVVRRDPRAIEALQILGDAYTKTGRLKEGLAIDLRLAKLCPTDSTVFYNLACSYSLLGKVEEALAVLDKAVRLGYDDATWLAKDPDLNNLRQDRRFARLYAQLSTKRRRRR
jgi:tetratricopeptide (TPR) repeat protein